MIARLKWGKGQPWCLCRDSCPGRNASFLSGEGCGVWIWGRAVKAGVTGNKNALHHGREQERGRQLITRLGLSNLRISHDLGNDIVTASHRIDPGQVPSWLVCTFPLSGEGEPPHNLRHFLNFQEHFDVQCCQEIISSLCSSFVHLVLLFFVN